jgi:hypothetical protein
LKKLQLGLASVANGKDSAMKRQLCVTAFSALVLVPDWVSACWPPARGPVAGPVFYHAPPPVYHAPVVYCPPVVYLPPCAPVAAAPLAPPRVEPARPSAAAESPKPARPPQVEAVRPAANVEPPKVPKADPPPDPAAEKKPAAVEPPKIAFPTLPGAKDPTPEPKLPPLVLPGEKEAPKLPGLDLPKIDGPKLPGLDLPKGDAPLKLPDAPDVTGAPAVPVPAPAPDALIPPPGVAVPRTPDALPPLSLPPDAPVSPGVKPTEAKSSPLTGGPAPRVSVFPAAGAAPATGLRKVGFYNHTDRDLSLTIEGRAVTLPAKTYLHAHLPASFTWRHGDRPAATETVPADASGVDVLFR